MWRQLNPAEQAKLLGSVMMSVSLFVMAASVVYFSYTIYITQRNVPAILAQLEASTNAVRPALEQVEPLQKMIPQILEEAAATRKLLPDLLDTTAKAVHEASTSIDKLEPHIPAALAEIEATRQAIPGLMDRSEKLVSNVTKSVHEASTSINKLEPQIPVVLAEVRETRQALPELMDRAEKLVESAGKAGQEASKGAVFGIVGGVLATPFKIIGGVGKGIFGSLSRDTEGGLTKRDEQLAIEASDIIIRKGKKGSEASWENPDSKNRGTVRLISQKMRNEQSCFRLHHKVVLASKRTKQADVEFCQNKDGTWTQRK